VGPEARWLLFYAVIVASMASVVWFFQIRRQMIARMRAVVGILEDVLRPRDKTYTLLGYLVGFRAVYELPYRWSRRAWILYTMPPGHVFFYLPVILLRREKDRLELTFRVNTPLPGEAHIYHPHDRHVARLVRRDTAGREGRLTRGEVVEAGKRFTALYSGSEALEKARQLLRGLLEAGADVRRVTLSDRDWALHVSIVPSVATLRRTLEVLKRYGEKLAGG